MTFTGEDGRNDPVRALLSVLRWRADHAPFFHYLNRLQAAALRLRIRSWGETGDRLHSRLESLPSPSRARIELAPGVFHLVLGAPDSSRRDVCNSLDRFCDVEQYIAGGAASRRPAETCWSALGDVRVTGVRDAGSELPSSYRQTGRSAFAPVVRNITLDGYSPILAASHLWYRPVEPHRPREFDAAVAQVAAALSLVASACAPAAQMLDACLRVVVLVRTREAPNKIGSVTVSVRPGQAGLLNLHSEAATPERVADALVHEAIHSLIRKVTMHRRLVVGGRRRASVESPWTGRPYSVVNFADSVFVWFGLWNFWNRPSLATERGASLAQKARRGFRNRSLLGRILQEARAALTPEAVQAIETMAAEVNDGGRSIGSVGRAMSFRVEAQPGKEARAPTKAAAEDRG